jgi:hypothetical protein
MTPMNIFWSGVVISAYKYGKLVRTRIKNIIPDTNHHSFELINGSFNIFLTNVIVQILS